MSKRGFTLMEILLALLIISIGMVSITGLLTSTLGAGSKARDDLQMVSFADMVLNQLHAETWETVTAGSITVTDYGGNPLTIAPGIQARHTVRARGKDDQQRDRFTVTYRLDFTADTDRIEAVLRVWPGYSDAGPPTLFQTEIYNWRKVQ